MNLESRSRGKDCGGGALRGLHAVSLSRLRGEESAALEFWSALPAIRTANHRMAPMRGRCRRNVFSNRAASTRLNVEIRFLQIVNRSIGKLTQPDCMNFRVTGEPEFELVDKLEVDGQTYVPWQEAMEREVAHAAAASSGVLPSIRPSHVYVSIAERELEPIRRRGWPDRRRHHSRSGRRLTGSVEIDLKPCRDGRVQSDGAPAQSHFRRITGSNSRADALMHSLVSAHTILAVEDGQFVSLLDPPENLQDLAAECSNLGTWPVLVGEEGARDTMLSSPIILYDYPQIAPESPGSLFDGTEIDEILSLRILTMTEEEKHEMRQSDERSPPDTGTHREHAAGAIHEASWRIAGAAPPQRGGAMNEWEWQLLEDKTLLDHVFDRRRRSKDGRSRAPLSAQGRRHSRHCAARTNRHGREHRAGLRGQVACVASFSMMTRDATWGCCGSRAIAFSLTHPKSNRLPMEEQRQKEVSQKPRILVAGIGNIFLGDDGFGVEVAQQLSKCDFPASVRVADFGIRGLDLAYALQDGYETTILIDAFPHGQPRARSMWSSWT